MCSPSAYRSSQSTRFVGGAVIRLAHAVSLSEVRRGAQIVCGICISRLGMRTSAPPAPISATEFAFEARARSPAASRPQTPPSAPTFIQLRASRGQFLTKLGRPLRCVPTPPRFSLELLATIGRWFFVSCWGPSVAKDSRKWKTHVKLWVPICATVAHINPHMPKSGQPRHYSGACPPEPHPRPNGRRRAQPHAALHNHRLPWASSRRLRCRIVGYRALLLASWMS